MGSRAEKRKSVLADGHHIGKAETGESAVAAAFEPFIKKAEVTKRLGTALRSVESWMQQGLLPYYKIGRSVCFKWSEVERHLKATCHVCEGE
jgi:excisionase family DNA binding protein